MTIEEIQNQIVDEFSMYDDWMDKYAYPVSYTHLTLPTT